MMSGGELGDVVVALGPDAIDFEVRLLPGRSVSGLMIDDVRDGRRSGQDSMVLGVGVQDDDNEVPEKRDDACSWGLGWFSGAWSGPTLLGHDGVTIGQLAYLPVLASQSTAVVVLTNGGRTADLADGLLRATFAQIAGEEKPPPLAPSQEPTSADVSGAVGTYRRAGTRSSP